MRASRSGARQQGVEKTVVVGIGQQRAGAQAGQRQAARVGLTGKALRRVVDLGAPAVVYVSCNPRSLARDLGGFQEAGYRAASLFPFDLFPHTPHLETLAVLIR